ncbi:uncharacterized protein FOMMEDRAFT_109238 [Fomitiporia mediterranea MF3/22]|uniref:uncharacterized protein n=1 Tax=Fomitiporia mediterranea (strain MF3/22) TaxID=694068 RepID=UPI000440858A|nr:uncharacterized protein FOMMEDRAFT_109238 [Fomitiporia mediterranea MF3/22]EJD02090.1 hypothetical protein FOMMEDRAFT_109238 [Fomitiporia mediterranea MF3/22]
MGEPLPIPESVSRAENTHINLPNETPSFLLGENHKSYRHQFSNIYFARLTLLKNIVEKKAKERWKGLSGSPPLVPRVLDVAKSQVCFIIGTVYLNMPQKPNVLEDVGRDRYLPEPAPREKYLSPEDEIVLEDDSGRVQLVGEALQRVIDYSSSEEANGDKPNGWGNVLVSGVIMAALGRETSSGAFEVKDVCFAGMAPMLFKSPKTGDNMEVDTEFPDSWIAFVSGLDMGESSSMDPRMQMLVEYLSGEAGAQEDTISQISRLVIAGNSLAPVTAVADTKSTVVDTGSKSKRFGQEASNFSPVPTNMLGDFLLDVASVMPVHLLAGARDPSGTLLPQQALPRAMFGEVKTFENFSCETNPAWLGFNADPSSGKDARQRAVLVHSGQSVEDMYKYVPSPPTTRLDLACATLQWRHIAPTAPDTLWCYPYQTTDPFVLKRTPDLYVVSCQPEFGTRLVSSNDFGETATSEDGERKCRVVLVPNFNETGCLVLVNMRSLEVKCVEFGLAGRLKDAELPSAEK